jgi:uncharacterized membrane protein
MTARTEGLMLMGVLLVVSCLFQVQLKLFAGELAPALARTLDQGVSRFDMVLRAVIGWRPLLIAVLAATLFSVWLLALTRLDLSLALPLAAVALAINALVGGLLLGEVMSLARIMGMAVITAGVLLVVRS